jgi:hypothetical protein
MPQINIEMLRVTLAAFNFDNLPQMKLFFVLTREDLMYIILVYSKHSSRFFTEIVIGLSGNDLIVVYQLDLLYKGRCYYKKSGGQILLVDADLHQHVLNSLYVNSSSETMLSVST